MNAAQFHPIGELAEFVGGGTPSRNNPDYFGGSIPWVTPKDMKTWQIRGAQIGLTEAGVENSATRVVPKNSVLVVVRSGVLKHTLPVGINRVAVAINQDMKALLCRVDVSPDYLAHFIRASAPEVLRWVRATTADNFPIDRLKALRVPLPSFPTQRRIAEVLDRADALRASRRASLVLLDALAESIFLDLFGDSEGAGWPSATVAEMALGIPGAIRTGPFGSQLLHDEFVSDGVAVLGIDNVVQNEFVWARPRFITPDKYFDLKRYTVRPRDVLITIMGTCGRCAIVPSEVRVAINTKHLCCITLDPAKCVPEFLRSYFLCHPKARRYLAMKAKGAIMEGLNMGIIKAMPIPMPPIALQKEYARRTASLEALRSSHRSSLDQMDALFASLQNRAFHGEL